MGGLLGSIFDFLGGTVASALESFVVWLYQLVVAVFQVLYQLLGIVANFLFNILQNVAKFFDRLWNGFFKQIFTRVWTALKAAQNWLETKLSPVIKFLQHLRQLLLRYYNVYIRPVLQMIQHMRQFLQILKALHIGFAVKLDAFLAQVQARIAQSFATIIAVINTLTDVVNAIMDPLYLLRKPALLLSIRRQIPALIRVVTGRAPGYFFPSPRGKAGGPFAPVPGNFNCADPATNPPASHYLGTDDGIDGLSVPATGFEYTSNDTDQAQQLDYFDDDLYSDNGCPSDPSECLLRGWGVINGQ